jgi:hypothetical protein
MDGTRLAGLVAAWLLSGCAHSPYAAGPAPGAQEPGRPGHAARTGDDCPMAVAGTEVSASEEADGELLTFTTQGEVADLRSRVREMARVHNLRYPAPGASVGMTGSDRTSPSYANVFEVEGGSSILLTPMHVADLGQLQEHVRLSAQRMRLHGCSPIVGDGIMPPNDHERLANGP